LKKIHYSDLQIANSIFKVDQCIYGCPFMFVPPPSLLHAVSYTVFHVDLLCSVVIVTSAGWLCVTNLTQRRITRLSHIRIMKHTFVFRNAVSQFCFLVVNILLFKTLSVNPCH